MPPKARISGPMIVDAAYALVRENGNEHLNVRAIAGALSCSTQPILYYFHSIEEIRQAVFLRAREEFLGSLFQEEEHTEIGLIRFCSRIVRFAAKEKHLFRMLFQCPQAGSMELDALLDSEEIALFLSGISDETGISEEDLAEIILRLISAAHGLASMTANGQMQYDGKLVRRILSGIWEDAAASFEDAEEE